MTDQEKEINVWKKSVVEDEISCCGGKNEKEKKKEGDLRKEEGDYRLLSWIELPEYMKDNEYIVNYYRADWPLKQAFFSLFSWHNETLNVWTHLLGFVLFLGLTIANGVHFSQLADFMTVFIKHFPTSQAANVSHSAKDFIAGPTKLIDLQQEPPPPMDLSSPATNTSWPFFVFLGGSMFCLLSSSVCHLFYCHSPRLNLVLLQMDYVGIAVMIITSFFPPIYYIFLCSPHWQIAYLTGITVMGIFIVITLLTPAFSTGKYRSFRAMLFLSLAFFGLIPAIHSMVVNWHDPHRNVILAYEGAMIVFYSTGTIFYVSRVPERWKPGWFDITGQSHQIFHVLVIMGALAHYGASKIFLGYRNRKWC